MQVDAYLNPFDLGHCVPSEAMEGQSILEILGGDLPGYRVMVGMHEIPRESWRFVRPKAGQTVRIYAMPHDGGTLRSVALVAVTVAAAAVTGGAAAGLFGAGTLTAGSVGATVAGVGVSILGSLAVNALIPPQTPDLGGSSQADRGNTITGGRNQARKYQPLPRTYGRVRWYPPLAANYYTEAAGSDQYLRMLVCLGYGPLEIDGAEVGVGRSKLTSVGSGVISIGETDISEYDGVSYEIGRPDQMTLYSRDVEEIRPAVNLAVQSTSGEEAWFSDNVSATRTTEPNTDEISVDLTFPQGLQTSGKDGNEQTARVEVEIDYRPVGGTWVNQVDTIISANTRDLFRRSFRWTVSQGQYEVRVTRVRTYLADRELVLADFTWSALRSIRNETPFVGEDAVLMALRIKATDQLEGVIDQLRIWQTSVLPVWDGSTWTEQATRNPAWAYADAMRGPQVRRPIPDSRIDLASLKDWADWADAEGWTYDFSHDSDETLPERLRSIAAAGLASYSPSLGGQIGVIREKDEEPTHLITPRNSWGFSATKTFPNPPHALKIRYVDGTTWQEDERIVYADGYSEANATRFEELQVDGLTDPDLVWRYGRRHLAQITLRPETYTVSMDFEQARFRRGDTVLLAHDVMLVGIGSARIRGISGTTVTLDQDVTLEAGKSYVARVQVTDTGDLELRTVTTGAGVYNAVDLADATGLSEGDLITLGEADTETIECKIAGITYRPDLDAEITLVDRAPGILTADTGTIPAYDPAITLPVAVEQARPASPVIDVARSDQTTLVVTTDGGFRPGLLVGWQLESDRLPIDRIEIRYRTGDEWTSRTYGPAVTQDVITGLRAESTAYIQIRARSIWGTWGLWSASEVVSIESASEPPSDVTGFDLVAQGDQAVLSWDRAPDIDVQIGGRVLVYHGSTGSLTDASPLDRLPGNATTASVALLPGWYLAVFEDAGGRQSQTPALIQTDAPQASLYNAVEVYTEPPATGTAVSGINITPDDHLELTADEGIYETGTVVDLGAPYSSRVWAQLTTETYLVNELIDNRTDLIDTWEDFDGTEEVSGPRAQMYIRTTLDDPAGTPTWSDWKRLTVGVYKARAYQLRIRLTRANSDNGIRLTEWKLYVDMPDRTEAEDEVTIPIGGKRITYSPAFKAKPKVGVTIEDAEVGDHYRRTNSDRTGFDLEILDNGENSVSRTVDWIAVGYGYEETP